MNDEIKEILDYLKDDKWDYYPSDGIPYKVFLCEERDILLDYITNLQEKVKQYENPNDMTLFYMWLDEKSKDKIKYLQQENKRLKEKK